MISGRRCGEYSGAKTRAAVRMGLPWWVAFLTELEAQQSNQNHHKFMTRQKCLEDRHGSEMAVP